ncbi:hypothetical protein [Microbacterium sp. AR7-10]|uniref:hypothetical protein n=1 Tax=Microbacterium sp. AR7-10 TaxID=1891970 RepID=UPI0008FC4A91|nr:hypothetical protein [Microbacterium sp. AR7-10]OIU88648.1 hypothetical protein BFN01_04185 [Microbacterium sp. AR7-10]
MAANVATITGKVLIQIADGEPVEVGTVEIPIYVGTERPKATRGRGIGTVRHVTQNGIHVCVPCERCSSDRHCAHNCPAMAEAARADAAPEGDS